MKLVLLSAFAIVISTSAFAQRGPRYNNPGSTSTPGSSNNGSSNHGQNNGSHHTTTTTHYDHGNSHNNHGTTYYDYGNTYYNGTTYYSGNTPRIIGPRYNPPSSHRVIRTTRRPQVVWSSGFGYACNMYGDLVLNGRTVHNFRYNSDCTQALTDIQYYGDFCDMEDLYDQTGYLEAQFTYSSECRSALGWYY